jgi:hypothetical protein
MNAGRIAPSLPEALRQVATTKRQVATFAVVANARCDRRRLLFGHRGVLPPLEIGKRFVAAGQRFGEGFRVCGREPSCAGVGRRNGFVFSQLSCVQRRLSSFCDIVWNRKAFGDQPFADGVVTLHDATRKSRPLPDQTRQELKKWRHRNVDGENVETSDP